MAVALSSHVSTVDLNAVLDQLIDKSKCILCFDFTLIDQLPNILREHHKVRSSQDASRHRHVKRLFELVDPSGEHGFDIDQLPSLIKATELDLSRFSTTGEVLEEDRQDFAEYCDESADKDLGGVLQLQSDLGQNLQKGEEGKISPHLVDDDHLHQYLTWVTTAQRGRWERFFKCDYWTLQIKKWSLLRLLNKNVASLSIGPRWLSEILYFRKSLGLTQHIGLDLHSEDESLVRKGDMHDMPFEDNTFGFIFIKNTIDKSYDVRKLIDEMVRVVRHGGIIAVDGNCFHGHATMLHRSDIQTAENLLRVVKARAKVKVLSCNTLDISGMGDAAASNAKRHNARLAFRVFK